MERNYMLDETMSYPSLFRDVFEPLMQQAERGIPAEVLRQVDTVYIYGSGDSLNAATCVCQSFWEYAQIPAYPVPAMPASRYIAPCLTPERAARTLTIAISNSGSAARTVEAAGALRKAGCKTAAFTAKPDSGVGNNCEYIMESRIPPFPKPSFPLPGIRSFGMPVLGLNLLAIRMGVVRGVLTEQQAQQLRQELMEVSDILEDVFQREGETLQAFGRLCGACRRMEFIATGPCRGAADFGVSKVLEGIGYAALSQDMEEFAHQTFFSIDTHQLPTVLIAPSRGRSFSRAKEILQVLQHLERPILVLTDGDEAFADASGITVVRLNKALRETNAAMLFSCVMTYLTSVIPLLEGDLYMHGHEGIYNEDGLPTVRGSSIEW